MRGDTAVRLPWLAPGAESLASLARPDSALIAQHLRDDPGFAALWLRSGAPDFDDEFDPTPLIRLAVPILRDPPAGRLDVSRPAVRRILSFSRACGQAAEQIARTDGFDQPLRAAVAGLLAPLGWLVAAAGDPESIDRCLEDSAFATAPESVQLRHWGSSAAALSRRTLRQWSFPAWLSAAIGNLDLPAAWALQVGGDFTLTAIVQQAVRSAASQADPLQLGRLVSRTATGVPRPFEPSTDDVSPLNDPYTTPRLADVLQLVLDNDSIRQRTVLRRLEHENEALRQMLAEQATQTDGRLSNQKLAALAEFAAGAGHEINNPLAVISGQAQYLLIKETEPDRQRALHAVVQQAQRIHHILTDLMQFARPAKPKKRLLDIRDVAGLVATNMHEFAALQRVRIELLTPDEPCAIDADPQQLQTGLACLLRNAVEAAPDDGWARLTIEQQQDRIVVVIEDSGEGPTVSQREHMFDPFYSGRVAGRGRGLGLPTAWRMAREQGGELTYDPRPDSPARFVLSLPRAAAFFSTISISA